jgi:ferredoxin
MIRKSISIDEELCNGCGLCINACHEGAIAMVGGKARLIRDEYCDGLGDCLPRCPTGAIGIIERESKAFDIKLVMNKKLCACPGTSARTVRKEKKTMISEDAPSQLSNWPIQLMLANPAATYFGAAHVLVAADCTAFAAGNFHKEYLEDRIVLIGCPKLDDTAHYEEKLYEIFMVNDIKSVMVVRMTVPCCGGISRIVSNAIKRSGKDIPFREVAIETDGEVRKNQGKEELV